MSAAVGGQVIVVVTANMGTKIVVEIFHFWDDTEAFSLQQSNP